MGNGHEDEDDGDFQDDIHDNVKHIKDDGENVDEDDWEMYNV